MRECINGSALLKIVALWEPPPSLPECRGSLLVGVEGQDQDQKASADQAEHANPSMNSLTPPDGLFLASLGFLNAKAAVLRNP